MSWMTRITGRRRIIALGALLVGLATAGTLAWRHLDQPYHFAEVTPGVLYRSGLLDSEDLNEVLGEHGIRTVVSLNAPRQGDEESMQRFADMNRICAERGVNHVDLPMKAEKPPRPGEVERWLEIVSDPANHPILVHCRHGVVRTGMLVAVYEMELCGRSNEEAIGDMPGFGHDLESPERREVMEFLRRYVPIRDRDRDRPETARTGPRPDLSPER